MRNQAFYFLGGLALLATAAYAFPADSPAQELDAVAEVATPVAVAPSETPASSDPVAETDDKLLFLKPLIIPIIKPIIGGGFSGGGGFKPDKTPVIVTTQQVQQQPQVVYVVQPQPMPTPAPPPPPAPAPVPVQAVPVQVVSVVGKPMKPLKPFG